MICAMQQLCSGGFYTVFMQRWVRGCILPVTLLSILSHSHPVGSSGNQLSDCSEQVSLGSTPAGEAEVAQQPQVTAYRRCKESPKEHACLGVVECIIVADLVGHTTRGVSNLRSMRKPMFSYDLCDAIVMTVWYGAVGL